jgi:hypothetical protein
MKPDLWKQFDELFSLGLRASLANAQRFLVRIAPVPRDRVGSSENARPLRVE